MANAYMITASGRKVSLPQPMPNEIFIDDIATHLARMPRYAGASIRPMSVAQHSVACAHLTVALARDAGLSDIPTDELVREALLHDAAEYLTNDIPSPIKLQFRKEWKRMQAPIESAIRKRFGLRATQPQCVNLADKALLILESEEIMVAPIDRQYVPKAASDALEQLQSMHSEEYQIAAWIVRQTWSEAEAYGAFLDQWNEVSPK